MVVKESRGALESGQIFNLCIKPEQSMNKLLKDGRHSPNQVALQKNTNSKIPRDACYL